MNRTKFSLSALQDPHPQHEYRDPGADLGAGEHERHELSVQEKSDMEILALQTAAMEERAMSAESAAEQAKVLRSQLQEEKAKTLQQSQKLTSLGLEVYI